MLQDVNDLAKTNEDAENVLEDLGSSAVAFFETEAKQFGTLATRTDEVIVKHVVREVTGELKAYMNKRWDGEAVAEDETGTGLSSELLSALALYSALLGSLVMSLPPSLLAPLQRRIGQALAAYIEPRIATSRVFSQAGGQQILRDVEQGWIAAARDAGVTRAPEVAWAHLHDAALLLALPAGTTSGISISKAMQAAWDTDLGSDIRLAKVLEQMGVTAMTERKEVQAVLRKRPEVWKS